MKRSFTLLVSLLFTVSVFSQTSWSLTGNAGVATSNFLGTTNNVPLIFKANNQWAGFSGYPDQYNVSFGYLTLNPLNAGTCNTAFGAQALRANTSGNGNIAIGTWTLDYNTTGTFNVAIGESASAKQNGTVNYNVAIGRAALINNAQSGNTAVGFESAISNTEGASLTAVGFKTLWNNTKGTNNSAFGFNSLINNTTGLNNTAVGAWSMVGNTTGEHNTTVGVKSLYANTTGEYNTAIGVQALELNTTGFWNTALGAGALNQNTTGYLNTAGGNSSLWFNTTGIFNTAFGEQSLGGSIDGSRNTAMGCRALWSILVADGAPDLGYGHGNNNTAVGYESLRDITSGSANVAVGMHALRVNSTGNENTALGNYALTSNTEGKNNVAIGNGALWNNTVGVGNTAIGSGANVSQDNFTNATAIGYGAVATESNQVIIGNANVTSIRGYVPMATFSDRRMKKDIQANVPGLKFINLLEPVTFHLDLDALKALLRSGTSQGDENDLSQKSASVDPEMRSSSSQLRTGFIAQDVEKAAKSIGYDFSGVDVNENGEGLYGLRYSEFIVPLVKAVQELSDQNVALQDQVETLTELVKRLLEKEPYLSAMQSMPIPNASLEQNFPNPFNQTTTINYTLPQVFDFAIIKVANASGNVIKQIPLSTPGSGSVTIEAGFLPAGVYLYSLYVNNTLVDTKKMVISK
ncbi:MAG: tail fiber domain-containing protein [Candidatus Azobacteroides sp.]|nr:tail fiber domain-containing protein [Candidatus Azobacteroides sp.]